jgi:NADPH2:quinone reductase
VVSSPRPLNVRPVEELGKSRRRRGRPRGVAGRSGSAIEAQSLWTKNNALRGVYFGGALAAEFPRVHALIGDLIGWVAGGDLHVEIDRSFPLAEAAAAHEYVEGRNAIGRVVMTP